jgi:hypothetical protein
MCPLPPACPEPYYNGGAVHGKSLDSDLVERAWRAEKARLDRRREQAEEHARQWWNLLVFGLYVTASGVVGVLVTMVYFIHLLEPGPFRTGGWF